MPTPSSQHDPQPGAAAAEPGCKQVVLVKQGQRYVFRYSVGEEGRLLTSLAEMARDPESDLDWFDAAVLCHQLGKGLGQQLERMSKS